MLGSVLGLIGSLMPAMAGTQAVGVPVRSLVRAEYGTTGHMVDVTWLVAKSFRDDGFYFKVNDEVLWAGAGHGQNKTLIITVRDDWFTFNHLKFAEGSVVRLPMGGRGSAGRMGEGTSSRIMLPATMFGPWLIERAEYGAIDVTQKVRSLDKDQHLDFTVSSATLGTKAGAGAATKLRILLMRGLAGETVLTFANGEHVKLRMAKAPDAPAWSVTKAEIGRTGSFQDVTAKVATQLKGDQFNFRAADSDLGVRVPKGLNGLSFRLLVHNAAGKGMAFQYEAGEYIRLTLP